MKKYDDFSKYNPESIYERMDISDYFTFEEEYKTALFDSFKRIRKHLLIFTGLFLICCILLFSAGAAILMYLPIVIALVSFAFMVECIRQFKYEASRYDFRMKGLVEKLSKHGVNIVLNTNDIKETIDSAYSKNGIKKKNFIIAGVLIILIPAICLGFRISSKQFTFNKWHDIDKRINISYELNDIIQWQMNGDPDNLNKDLDFRGKTLDEVRGLLGYPEIAVTRNILGTNVETFDKYESYMGNPTTYDWDLNDLPEMHYECYFLGTPENSSSPRWFAIFWIDGKIRYAYEFLGNTVHSFANYEIDTIKQTELI